MFEIHYCDRCGRGIPQKVKSADLICINGYSDAYFNDEGRVSVAYTDQQELCVECSKIFRKIWLTK